MRDNEFNHGCLLCYKYRRSHEIVLCPTCVNVLRKEFNITEQDLIEAKERGAFRDSSMHAKWDKAMSKLDQLESKHWLSRSIEAKMTG